jgi:hypothetical protein
MSSFFRDLTLHDLTMMVAGVGVFGIVLIAIGMLGVRRSRAARRASIAP